MPVVEVDAYNIGDIVTLKSHPLLKNNTPKNSKKQFPPLLLIKEAIFENKKKKLFSDEIPNAKIADNLKYLCVYFNDRKSEFVEIPLYHAYLASYKGLKLLEEKKDDKKAQKSKVIKEDKRLIIDGEEYKPKEYEFGTLTQFKTCKLESRKVDKNMKFSSPDFVLTGIKREVSNDLFYHDGKPKRKISEIFYKVMWFNHYQNKFSEKYLPKEFFIEPLGL